MKKLLIMASILVLLGLSASQITEAEAKEVALALVAGEVVHAELVAKDTDEGAYFAVEIQTERGIAEVKIDAYTGDVLETRFDHDDWVGDFARSGNQELGEVDIDIRPINQQLRTFISSEDAQEIALEYASGRIISTDFDDGYFFVHVLSGMTLREITIDQTFGQILDVDAYPLLPVAVGAIIFIGAGIWLFRRFRRKSQQA